MDVDPSAISFNVLLGVLLVDILLSGDNAIVIALVCRGLPRQQQVRVMWMGIAGALVARLLLTMVATLAMQLPLIKLVGGVLLLKIAVSLIVDNIEPKLPVGDEVLAPGESILAAAKTIILADVIMSLDNVLALSAVTQNNFSMLVLGLLLSIPILMFGSIYIARLLDAFPLFLWLGAGILGGVAGGLLIDDPLFGGIFSGDSTLSHFVIPVLAAVFVVQISRIIIGNRAALQNVSQPPSLWQILTGAPAHAEVNQSPIEAAQQRTVPEVALTAADPPQPPQQQPESMPQPAPTEVPNLVVTASPSVSPSPGKPQKDYRVVGLLAAFVVLVGWAIYALVSAEPPPVPERLAAYRCKDPALVVQYRASARQVRIATGKGVVEARFLDDRIVWDDYAAASKTLELKPPMQIVSAQPGQIVLQGGDFAHSVCPAANAR